MIQIANDGNLLPAPVTLTALDEMGIAERYDIVIDFSNYSLGDELHMVSARSFSGEAEVSRAGIR